MVLQVGLLVLWQHLGLEGQQLCSKAMQTVLNLLSGKAVLSSSFFFPFFQWAMEMMTSECMWLQLPWKRTQAARSAGCAAEQCAVSTASWDVL